MIAFIDTKSAEACRSTGTDARSAGGTWLGPGSSAVTLPRLKWSPQFISRPGLLANCGKKVCDRANAPHAVFMSYNGVLGRHTA